MCPPWRYCPNRTGGLIRPKCSARCCLSALRPVLLAIVLLGISARCGLRDETEAAAGFPVAQGATADKPQSKLWYHDGSWWCILDDGSSGSFFYRFVQNSWQKQTFLKGSPRGERPSRADVLCRDQILFVLLWNESHPHLYKYVYVAGEHLYDLVDGFPVTLALPPGHETLVLTQDSTGVLWATFELDGRVWVRWSDPEDQGRWDTAGLEIGEGLQDDDIASLISLDQQIGVFWSNQNTQSLHFRVHQDGSPMDTWEATELVAQDGLVADDHINLAYSGSGYLYAVTKTSVDDVRGPVVGPTQAQFILNVRSPNGEWRLYDIQEVSRELMQTRPIVLLDETNARVYVAYKRGDAIVYEHASMADPDFSGDPVPLIQVPGVSLNNVTSTKQNLDALTKLMVLATGNNSRAYHGLIELQ